MNVYQLEFETKKTKAWICAHTIIQALQIYCAENRLSIHGLNSTDKVVVVPSDKWDTLTFEFVDTKTSLNLAAIMAQSNFPHFIGEN